MEWQGLYRQRLPLWHELRERRGGVAGRGAALRQPLCGSTRIGDFPLSDHLPGEALAIDRELVIVDSGNSLTLTIEITSIPERPVLAAAQAETVDSLA